MTKPWQLHRERLMPVSDWQLLDRYLREQAEIAEKRKTRRAIRVRSVLCTAAFAGLRRSEVASLRCGDLHLANDSPFLVVRRSKSGFGEVVISPQLRRLLKQYLRHKHEWGENCGSASPVFVSQRGAYTGSGVWRMFRTACRNAGIRQLGVHALRHLFGTVLYQARRDVRLVQRQLRHARVSTTQVYIDVSPEWASEGMVAFDRFLAKGPTDERAGAQGKLPRKGLVEGSGE